MTNATAWRTGFVASGHRAVSSAAVDILDAGGNAFDAIVAAGFASPLAEPALTSLGGGGFCLTRDRDGEAIVFDFFCDTPGLSAARDQEPHFEEVVISFPGADQAFHIGRGSCAVPGSIKGLLHIHARLGRLPLHEVIAPARALAAEGALIDDYQSSLLALLTPIVMHTPESRALYAPKGHLLRGGERAENAKLASLLDALVDEGDRAFYEGEVAARIASDMAEGGGLLTAEDLAAYRVIERKPLQLSYRGHTLLTNPAPSFGGGLIALGLSLLERSYVDDGEAVDRTTARLVAAMIETDRLRKLGIMRPADLDDEGAAIATERMHRFSRGTTHISVADREGNVASMTTSNGEGSGYVAPGTGVLLNNMMGEDDLHPDGFHQAPAGTRVSSMMSPTLITHQDETKLVLGSGGSKRIRTALLQVISRVLDQGLPLREAIEHPRAHFDGEVLQFEPGALDDLDERALEGVATNGWSDRNLYFGGVHGVVPGQAGTGDPRRAGVALSSSPTPKAASS